MRNGSITSSSVSRGSDRPAAKRFDADRAAAVKVGDHRQIAPVHRVEPERVDLQPVERLVGDLGVDRPGARSMGEVADPAEQAARNPRGAPRAAGDLVGAVVGQLDAEQAGGAADDLLEFLDRVEIEPNRDAEAVAKRRGQQPLPGGRADQREARQVDAHRARRRPFADHQVERPVLHRRVKHFLDRRSEPVDLVDEQDVAVLEVGEQGSEVARLGDHRAGGGAEADPHFASEDAGERRLAEAGRAVQQHMVERFAAALRGGDEHPQILPRRLLADELVERLGPKRRVGIFGGALGRGDSGGIGRHISRECSQCSR